MSPHQLKEQLLLTVAQQKATDVYLSARQRPMLRVSRQWVPLEGSMDLTDADVVSLAEALQLPSDQMISVQGYKQSLTMRIQRLDWLQNPALSIRIFPVELPRLSNGTWASHLTGDLLDTNGLYILTSSRGEGRTTLLASVIEHVNRHRAQNVLWVADYFEYKIAPEMAALNYVTRDQLVQAPDAATAFDTLAIDVQHWDDGMVRFILSSLKAGQKVMLTIRSGLSLGALHEWLYHRVGAENWSLLVSVWQGTMGQALVPAIGGGQVAVHEYLWHHDFSLKPMRERAWDKVDQSFDQFANEDFVQSLDVELLRMVQADTVGYKDALAHGRNRAYLQRELGTLGLV